MIEPHQAPTSSGSILTHGSGATLLCIVAWPFRVHLRECTLSERAGLTTRQPSEQACWQANRQATEGARHRSEDRA
eukprot:9531901-Alexandrium_andersonii.AAC.1